MFNTERAIQTQATMSVTNSFGNQKLLFVNSNVRAIAFRVSNVIADLLMLRI